MGLVLLELTSRRERSSKIPREILVRKQQGRTGTIEQHKSYLQILRQTHRIKLENSQATTASVFYSGIAGKA